MKPLPPIFEKYIQSDNKNLFDVFNCPSLGINWKDVSILDYGCNQGNFINSAKNYIDPNRYLGIDITNLSIELAKQQHPDFNFTLYNKWHQAYNPTGDKTTSVLDIVDKKFDIVIAYSVFTHNTIDQAKEELADLKKLLSPRGKILFTIWRASMFASFYEFEFNKYANIPVIDCNSIAFDKMAYWVDTSKLITDDLQFQPTTCRQFNSYYNLEWFEKEMGNVHYLGKPKGQHQDLFLS
jgi:SAM-dependent methyltransferase